MIDTILEIIICVLCLVIIALFFVNNKKGPNGDVKDAIKDVKKDILDDNSRSKNDLLNNMTNYLDGFKGNINDRIEILTKDVKENTEKIEKYLNSIRETLSNELDKLRNENQAKLDEMQKVVNEKLDETLNTRLTQSFKLVQDNLSKVEVGLGEMKSLAEDVNGLQRTLSNVKTRGIWGEMQLSKILSDMLTPDQYCENVVTKDGSKDPVEFAVKLPGETGTVLLPIDSKFPLDCYNELIDATNSLDKDRIEAAQKDLKRRIVKFAEDIKSKYIDVPHTTDFGIMFLPIEGLYAEVAKSGLIDELQTNKRIIIAGPTTMSALLNSLQVGFRTLAIEKRSTEVWNVLGAVKTEFGKFSDALKKAQKKINDASDDIESLVGTRTNQIQRKLKSVTELDSVESAKLIGAESGDDLDDEQ